MAEDSSPAAFSPALRKAVEDCARGDVPPTVAAMRVLMESGSPGEGEAAVQRARALADGDSAARLGRVLDLIQGNPQAWHTVRGVLAGMDHRKEASSTEEGVAYWAAVFDNAARVSPEASVALYSLGNPDLLRAATGEILDLLRGWGLLGQERAVLDLGCGIGRFAEGLAPEVGEVVGIDVSPEMLRVAETRLAHLPNLRFMRGSGRDLSRLEPQTFDLVLAVDVFPYLVQAGLELAEVHIREAARVLRPGGSLVVLNFSYRGDRERDWADLAAFASVAGLTIKCDGQNLLSLWDGAVFHLTKNVSGGLGQAGAQATPKAPRSPR